MEFTDNRSDISTYILGGWDLAICAALFFQGILWTQFIRYMTANKRDSVLLKLFVAGLALLTTLKTIQAISMLWILNDAMVNNPESDLWQTHWLFHTAIISTAIIAFYVQTFFCYRLWASAISRNICLIIVTMALFIVALAAAAVATSLTYSDTPLKSIDWIAAHLGTAMCGDLLLTGGTVFWLLRHSNVVLPRGQTARMLDSLLRLTIHSAAPAAVCAFVNFGGGHVISNMILPKLYAISAMWILNSRDDIRAALEHGPTMHTLDFGAAMADRASGTETGTQSASQLGVPVPFVEDEKFANPGTFQDLRGLVGQRNYIRMYRKK
ncbi:hypothetical protein B0H14DRAFT_3468759 [Mycena olivaceomarginata]|nr:hypothetical protein B0H14DRAFT_3468759 [Mycena olivaceomarginata]